jgi:predicted MPP superfamily phosphohydrolase
MITRRGILKLSGGFMATGAALGAYAFVIEPGFLLRAKHYAFLPPRWTPGLKLRLVLLSDPHLVEPHMPLSRWQKIISTANELDGDMVLLLGDYAAGHRWRTGSVPVAATAKAAAALKAPLGVYAIIGNHDWWDDHIAVRKGEGPVLGERAMADNGIPTLTNRAVRIVKNGQGFWLSGTDSMFAIPKGRNRFESRADLAATLAQITDDTPVIHMAHEPDLFVRIPDRVSLTVSGHTHGGQVRLFGHSPIVPSAYGNRFAYGHVVEDGRHLLVSGGLGCSIMPVRFGVPPEITVIDLG